MNRLSMARRTLIVAGRRAREAQNALKVHGFTLLIFDLIFDYASPTIQSASHFGESSLTVLDDGTLFVRSSLHDMIVELPFPVSRVAYSVLHAADGSMWRYRGVEDGAHAFTRIRPNMIPLAPFVWRHANVVQITKWHEPLSISSAGAISTTASDGCNVTVLFRDRIVRSTPNGTVVTIPVPPDLEFVTACSGCTYTFALTGEGRLYIINAAVKEDVFAPFHRGVRSIAPLCPATSVNQYGCAVLALSGKLFFVADTDRAGWQWMNPRLMATGVHDVFVGLHTHRKRSVPRIREHWSDDDSD
jgi:hypothetical protein